MICSAALVIIVPLICTMKVMAHARMHILCFFHVFQLKGLSVSFGSKSMVLFVIAGASFPPFARALF